MASVNIGLVAAGGVVLLVLIVFVSLVAKACCCVSAADSKNDADFIKHATLRAASKPGAVEDYRRDMQRAAGIRPIVVHWLAGASERRSNALDGAATPSTATPMSVMRSMGSKIMSSLRSISSLRGSMTSKANRRTSTDGRGANRSGGSVTASAPRQNRAGYNSPMTLSPLGNAQPSSRGAYASAEQLPKSLPVLPSPALRPGYQSEGMHAGPAEPVAASGVTLQAPAGPGQLQRAAPADVEAPEISPAVHRLHTSAPPNASGVPQIVPPSSEYASQPPAKITMGGQLSHAYPPNLTNICVPAAQTLQPVQAAARSPLRPPREIGSGVPSERRLGQSIAEELQAQRRLSGGGGPSNS